MGREAERRSTRIALILIGALFLAYAGFKFWHVSLALDAYALQPVTGDISGAAK